MKRVDQEYLDAMNAPLREATEVWVTFMGENETRKFKGRDLIATDHEKEVDPVSRRLPVNKFSVTVVDFDRSVLEDPFWKSGIISVSVTYLQTLESGSLFPINPSDDYYYDSITHEGFKTTIKCVDILQKYVGMRGWGTWDDWKMNSKTLADNIRFYEPGLVPEFKSNVNIDYKLKRAQDPYGETVAEEIQYIANAMAAGLHCNGKFITIHVFLPKDIPTATGTRKLRIRDVFKNSIKRIQSPKIGAISLKRQHHEELFEGDDPISMIYEGDAILVDGIRAEVTLDSPNGSVFPHYEDYPRVVLIPAVTDFPDLQSYIGRTIFVKAQRRLRAVYTEKSIQIAPKGITDRIDNAYMVEVTASDFLAKYYGFRNSLKIGYRGDPSIEPGDGILFEYEPGKYVSCLVLSNHIKFDGTLHGEIVLKVLLTDEQIERGEIDPPASTRSSSPGPDTDPDVSMPEVNP